MTTSSQPHPVDWDLCMNTGGTSPVGRKEWHTLWVGHLSELTLANRRWLPSQGKLKWSWMREVIVVEGLCFGISYYRAYATINFTWINTTLWGTMYCCILWCPSFSWQNRVCLFKTFPVDKNTVLWKWKWSVAKYGVPYLSEFVLNISPIQVHTQGSAFWAHTPNTQPEQWAGIFCRGTQEAIGG